MRRHCDRVQLTNGRDLSAGSPMNVAVNFLALRSEAEGPCTHQCHVRHPGTMLQRSAPYLSWLWHFLHHEIPQGLDAHGSAAKHGPSSASHTTHQTLCLFILAVIKGFTCFMHTIFEATSRPIARQASHLQNTLLSLPQRGQHCVGPEQSKCRELPQSLTSLPSLTRRVFSSDMRNG